MLKLQVNDLVKILTVDEIGECKDGRTYVRCSALSFFDEDETYMVLTAFGAVADMIANNHTGDNMRRALVSGHLEITKGKAKQKVRIDGAVKTIMVPDYQFQILADSVRFIDKNRSGEVEEDLEDDEDVVEFEIVDENTQETAATVGDVSIVDDEDDTPKSNKKTKTINKKTNKINTPTRNRK